MYNKILHLHSDFSHPKNYENDFEVNELCGI